MRFGPVAQTRGCPRKRMKTLRPLPSPGADRHGWNGQAPNAGRTFARQAQDGRGGHMAFLRAAVDCPRVAADEVRRDPEQAARGDATETTALPSTWNPALRMCCSHPEQRLQLRVVMPHAQLPTVFRSGRTAPRGNCGHGQDEQLSSFIRHPSKSWCMLLQWSERTQDIVSSSSGVRGARSRS